MRGRRRPRVPQAGSLKPGGVAEGANVRYAQAQTPAAAGVAGPDDEKASGKSAQAPQKAADQQALEEVVVTANKRAVNIQDLGLSITAIGRDTIQKRSLTGMGDYLSTVPGVTQSDLNTGNNKVVIRGIAASQIEDATVAVYFGEVPLTSVASGNSTDFKLVDMERIEVLRGPQGTLYGSGSMGGTIRNIPREANLNTFEGEVQAGYSSTAGDPNGKGVAVLNVPVVPGALALRVAAYDYSNAGFVDNVGASDPMRSFLAQLFGAQVLDKRNVGDSDWRGVRAQALYKPTDALQVKLTYARQDLSQDGDNSVDTTLLGSYQAMPFQIGDINGGVEEYTDVVQFSNLVVQFDQEWGSILSSSTWLDGSSDFARDSSRILPAPLPQEFDAGNDAFTQEIRFVSNFDGPVQLVGGVFYEDASRFSRSHLSWGGSLAGLALIPFLGNDPDALLDTSNDFKVKQKAVFGEVSYDINERLAVTVGGRYFDYDRREDETQVGPVAGGGVDKHASNSEDGTSLKVNLEYRPGENALFYAQWAEGFRLGHPVTPAPASVCDLDNDGLLDGTNSPIDPGSVASDTLNSYDLGAKFSFLRNRLIVDAAAFWIDWQGIPVTVISQPNCGFSVQVNAGEARSRGLEFEAAFQVSEALKLELGGAYVDAELSEDSAQLGPAGTRLPGSAKYAGNAAVQYDFNVGGHDAFARIDYAYVGSYWNDLAKTQLRSGGYGKLGARVGLDVNHLSVEVYGTNLTNSNDYTLVITPPYAFRLVPRTVGIDFGYRW